jgi:hypothetical protein
MSGKSGGTRGEGEKEKREKMREGVRERERRRERSFASTWEAMSVFRKRERKTFFLQQWGHLGGGVRSPC